MTLLPKLFLPILLTLSLTACGLFRGSKDESPPADVAATEGEAGDFGFSDGDDFGFSDDDFAFSEGDNSFGAAAEGSTGEGAADDMFGDSDFFSDDSAFPESPLSDAPTDTATSDPFATDPFATDSTDTAADPFAADSSTDAFATDSSMGSDFFTADSSYDSFGEATETKSYVPVKKMADSAFDRGGAKLNRLYVVREGDTLASISERIFGQDRTSDLTMWNPYFASNDPKVGDKVYYPSPTNPDDNTMMTYYDDRGLAAETYVASAGDNIRAISKDLLGHDRSWMEIWATNPSVESKGELAEGATLRYWPSGVSAPAQASTPEEEDPFGAPLPSPTDVAESSPSEDPFGSIDPPSNDLGGLNPPPSFGNDDPFGDSDTAMAPPPPPPPPPRQVQPGEELSLPPPPPPPPRAAQKPATAGGEQDNMILILGGAGLLVLILVFLIMRKKKSSIDMGHTQV